MIFKADNSWFADGYLHIMRYCECLLQQKEENNVFITRILWRIKHIPRITATITFITTIYPIQHAILHWSFEIWDSLPIGIHFVLSWRRTKMFMVHFLLIYSLDWSLWSTEAYNISILYSFYKFRYDKSDHLTGSI